jgi:hypothetical protein
MRTGPEILKNRVFSINLFSIYLLFQQTFHFNFILISKQALFQFENFKSTVHINWQSKWIGYSYLKNVSFGICNVTITTSNHAGSIMIS